MYRTRGLWESVRSRTTARGKKARGRDPHRTLMHVGPDGRITQPSPRPRAHTEVNVTDTARGSHPALVALDAADPRTTAEAVLFEIRRVIVGQDQMLERVLVALLAGGHLLLEGVPGLAKTLTIRTLADALDASFRRIQFTPDLVP